MMFQDTFTTLINNNLIVGITALMIILFFIDFLSYFVASKRHRDFKSILVSIGVTGTFIGVFLGLLGFDSSDISGSVPKLLDGLKIAFITSIIGMGLAIFLSIIQKFKGGDNEEDEIVILNNIHKRLEKLDDITDKLSLLEDVKKHTENLLFTNTKLESIDANIKIVSKDISNVKDELKANQRDLFSFLKDKLSEIDNSLKEAVKSLSEGATEEIIKALEGVIQDFNNNLTDQFGDNFKQLNEAVLNMIEWQDNYKNSVEMFEEQLKETLSNTNESHEKTASLIEVFVATNNQVLLNNIEKINTITTQYTDNLITRVDDFSSAINNALKESIEQNQQVNDKTKESLQIFVEASNQTLVENIEKVNDVTAKNTDSLISKVGDFSDSVSNTLKENIEQNQQANKKVKEQLSQLFEQVEVATSTTEANAKHINAMTNDYERISDISKSLESVITTNQNQLNNLESHLKTFAEIGNNAKGITDELKEFSKTVQGSLSDQSVAVAELTKNLKQQLPQSLEALEDTLTALTKDFAKNYEEFLKRFNEIKQNNN